MLASAGGSPLGDSTDPRGHALHQCRDDRLCSGRFLTSQKARSYIDSHRAIRGPLLIAMPTNAFRASEMLRSKAAFGDHAERQKESGAPRKHSNRVLPSGEV